MKHIKLYENFLSKIEDMVKGKTEKGKILAELLKKNNIPVDGFAYAFKFLGGDLTDECKSHPLSFLWNHEPNKGKAKFENEKISIPDDFKNKKVVNILPMLDKEEKEGIQKHGRIQSSAVIKFNYKFDLSKDVPTLEMSNAVLFNIETGNWEKNEKVENMNKIHEIDGEYEDDLDDLFGSVVFNTELVTTYQNFIDELNKRDDTKEIIKDRFDVTNESHVKRFNNFM